MSLKEFSSAFLIKTVWVKRCAGHIPFPIHAGAAVPKHLTTFPSPIHAVRLQNQARQRNSELTELEGYPPGLSVELIRRTLADPVQLSTARTWTARQGWQFTGCSLR